MHFAKGELIGSYTVTFPHKQGAYAETYRVKAPTGETRFLKLIFHHKLKPCQVDSSGAIAEQKILQGLVHPNICTLVDSGDLLLSGGACTYLVFEYFSSETLAVRLSRQPALSVYEIKEVARAVLSALIYLHTQAPPILHGEVTAQNILSGFMPAGQYKLIDFGAVATFPTPLTKPDLKDLNPFYLAPERFAGVAQPQSEIYAVGALLYQLLYERLPWFIDLSAVPRTELVERILAEREKPLSLPVLDKPELDKQFIHTIAKALSYDVEERFTSAEEMLRAINGELAVDPPSSKRKMLNGDESKPALKRQALRPEGKGFSAVAGMDELKDKMREEVIEPLQHPEEYHRYGITIPNGMLLYGPPGCGKTFFAKHFAEEVGFNYMCITPASLKSRYVNATQENIAKMFAEAKEQAPTIIFIDEINELLPNRESNVHEMSRGAVNEMLAQMDRTGEQGVFIIGATNYPHQIDPAMLRAGRLERKYYLGVPDAEARRALFEMYLEPRPIELGMDYEALINLSEGYVSADIQLIVNDAARSALKAKSKITLQLLKESIASIQPSLSAQELARYEEIRRQMDREPFNEPKQRPRVGFE